MPSNRKNKADCKSTVLIVSDSSANSIAITDALGGEFELIQAENGNRVIDILKDNLYIDAIILDIENSTPNSCDVLNSIHGISEFENLPAVVVTEDGDDEGQLRALRCGAQDVIMRSCHPEILLHRVTNVIRSCRVDRQAEEHKRIDGAADFLNAPTQATLMFNSSVGGAQIVELSGDNLKALRVSDQFFRVIGVSREEYAKSMKHLQERFYPRSRQLLLNACRLAEETGEEQQCELQSLPSDSGDSDIWTFACIRHLVTGEDRSLFYLTVENITGQKDSDAKLRMERQKTDYALHDANMMVWEYDIAKATHTRIGEYGMEKFPAVLEGVPESVIANQMVSPVSADSYRQLHKAVVSGEETPSGDMLLRDVDGEYRWHRVAYRTVFSEGKPIGAIGTSMDITGEVEAMSRKRELEMVLDASSLYLWTYDLNTGTYSVVNKNAASLGIGRSADGKAVGLRESKCLAPDGLARINEKFEKLYSDLAGGSDGNVVLHMEKSRSGMEWMRVYYAIIRDSNGQAVSLSFVGEDCTEAHKNEIMYAEALTDVEQGNSGNAFVSILVDVTADRVEACRGTFAYEGMKYSDAYERLCELVYVPEHRKAIEETMSREAILHAFRSGNHILNVEYQRFLWDKNIPHWVRTTSRTFKDTNTGHIKSLQFSVDIDLEMTDSELAGVTAENNYELLGMIYTDSQYIHCYRHSSMEESLFVGVDCDYLEGIQEYVNRYIHPDSRAEAHEKMSLDRILKELESKKIYSVVFPVMWEKALSYKKWTFCWLNDDRRVIVISRADVTEAHVMQQHTAEMSSALDSLGTAICRYDVKSRTLTMPEDYADAFGLPAVAHNIPYSAEDVPPGERDDYTRFYERIINGEESGDADIQFILRDGVLRWEHVTFVTTFDEDHKPVSAVITAKDITSHREAVVNAQLTRLLLEQSGFAMFDYDVRSDTLTFEAIQKDRSIVRNTYNDYYQHVLHSDVVHPQSAETLRKIIRDCRKGFVSGTVEYIADNWGTGHRWCRIYYMSIEDASGKVYRLIGQISDIQEEKDREDLVDDLQSQILGERDAVFYDPVIIPTVFRYLANTNDVGGAINHVLELLGAQYKVDRIYVFEDSHDHKRCTCTFEWCGENVTSFLDYTQNVEYESLDEDFKGLFGENHVLSCIGTENLPPGMKDMLMRRGVQSMMLAAMIHEGEFIGFIGFETTEIREWSKQQLGTLIVISDVVTMSIMRERGKEAQVFSEDFRNTMDDSSLYLYVIEPESYRILYRNKSLRELSGECEDEELCHRLLIGSDMPCDNCPINNLDENGKYAPTEVYYANGICMLAQASRIRWNGQSTYMVTCTDITDRKQMEESLRIFAEENAIVIRQSGKRALRYDIAMDTAENLLDAEPIFGLSGSIEKFSTVLVDNGILAEESLPAHMAMMEDIRAGKPEGFSDVLMHLGSGNSRWFHCDYNLVYDRGDKPSHAILSFYDNTDLREKEIAYQKWITRLDGILASKEPYIEANVTQDFVERFENLRHGYDLIRRPEMSAYADYVAENLVHENDRAMFRKFFDRQRMLTEFYSNNVSDSMEYRIATLEGRTWFRVDLQMVKYPYSDDVKAFAIFNNIDEDVNYNEQLEETAFRDPLTGLYNRGSMESQINTILKDVPSTNTCALFMIDLDNFKSVNDTLGHMQGDEAIIYAGNAIGSVFRDTDLMGRVGGDEFMVFIQKDATRKVVKRKARQLLQKLQFSMSGVSVSASIGIALSTGTTANFETLYVRADQAMYTSKRNGKNSYSLYGSGEEVFRCNAPRLSTEAVELDMLLKFMDGGIVLGSLENDDLQITYASPSLESGIEDLGFDGQMMNDLYSVIYPPDLKMFKSGIIDAVKAGKYVDITFRVGKSGENWRRLRGKQLPDNGTDKVTRLIGVVADVTALKELDAR